MFRALPKRLSSTERPNCTALDSDFPIIALSGPSTELGVMGLFDHAGLVSAVQYSEKAAFLAEKPLGDLTLNEAQAACLFALGYRFRRTLAAREGCAIPKPVQ